MIPPTHNGFKPSLTGACSSLLHQLVAITILWWSTSGCCPVALEFSASCGGKTGVQGAVFNISPLLCGNVAYCQLVRGISVPAPYCDHGDNCTTPLPPPPLYKLITSHECITMLPESTENLLRHSRTPCSEYSQVIRACWACMGCCCRWP